MESDRRHAPRFQFVAECEVIETASGTKLKGRISDLSSSGCFVDTLNPSPECTAIRIAISHGTEKFVACGQVTSSLQNMGMGVIFTEVEAGQLAVLEKWCAQLG